MLARANLHRIRGQWEEATDWCARVLEIDPSNANAHSLLGDINQDQGKLEAARHWYQLALDLNPRSEADRAKLSRVEETLEAREQREEWEAVIAGRSQPIATSLLVREALQRVGALVGAGLCGIILVMAMLVSITERGQLDPQAPDEVLVPRPTRPTPPVVAELPRERELLKRTRELGMGGAGQPVRVELDPRGDVAHLRVLFPQEGRRGLRTQELRLALMREGYRWAKALHEADGAITVIHVYMVGPTVFPEGHEDLELMMVGALARENLVLPVDRPTPEELNSFYMAQVPMVWGPSLSLMR